MNKADFDRDCDAWLEVEERMHRLLAPLVARLSGAVAPPPAGAARAAEQVRRLLAQALRMVDGEPPYAGFESPARPARDAASAQQELAMPPARAAGTRRAGLGRIALRPLERTVRSQTVEEDGTRVIVINTRHPLFLERRGDTWYQLETAAREMFRGVEGMPIAEYERRVDELLVAALALHGRRRRRRRPRARQPQLQLQD